MKDLFRSLYQTMLICLTISVIGVLFYTLLHGQFSFGLVKSWGFYSFYFGFPLGLLNGYFFDWLDRRLHWDKQAKSRALIGAFGSIILTMIAVFILNGLIWCVYYGYPFNSLFEAKYRPFYLVSLLITVMISVTMHALAFFKKTQEQKRINHRLKAEKLTAELGALKSHIDPHFLFNCFNILAGLIDENPKKAQKFLTGLSRIYRYVLDNRNADTKSIADELKFAQQYLDLQKARFEESIQLKLNINEDILTRSLPSLSLQILLENAIKHNAFDADAPLIIKILEQDGCLVIKNNKSARINLNESSGIGLKNISDRYALLSSDKIQVLDTNDTFTVKLPLL